MLTVAPSLSSLRCLLVTILATVNALAGLTAAPSHGPAGYTLREWHEQDGVPSEELAAVLQDADGYLWVAARSALVRFDGVTFDPVEVPTGSSTGGLALRPRAHPNEAAGIVFPGIRKTGTVIEAGCYVRRGGTFHFEPEPELAGRDPRVVFFAPDGARWIGCEDGTLLWRSDVTTRLFPAPLDLAGRRRPDFATDATGELWIRRGDRLARVRGGEWTEVPVPAAGPELRIASSAAGGLWVLTRSALLRWTGESFAEIVSLPERQGAHFIQAAVEDNHGYLWLGTRSQGLFRVAGREILSVPVSSNDVTALSEDAEGNLWVATDGGGLNRLRAKAHQLFDQASGLKDNVSYTVAEDVTGAIWLANRDGGMARIVESTVDALSQRAAWRSFSARSVYPAPNGTVWITTGIGVFRTRASAPEILERVSALNHLRGVRATLVARQGDYWLAADPDRVVRWRDGQITTFGPDDGFDAREVRAFAEDAAGRIWVGAADGRVLRFDGGRFERIMYPFSDDAGSVQVIRVQLDGTLLIGTTRRGVLVAPQGDFTRMLLLDREHGLADNNISQILTDDHDRVWFASRRGIFWVHGGRLRDFVAGRAADVHSVMLGKDDGLPYLSCQGLFQPAAWKASDGTLWFATRRGMLRTDPALIGSGNDRPPTVTISRITCDDRTRSPTTTMEVKSTVKKIELRLSAVNLSAPESVQIRTRLDGFDSDWVVQGPDRVVRYPRLPPGQYVFNTMASTGSGSWNEQTALLTLLVSPPWWQSPWFVAAYVFVSILVIGAIVRRWSHRRLRRRLEQAERDHAIELERSRIARNIHDDVGASLTRISLLTQAAQQQDRAPSATLEKIHEATRAITRSMDEIVWTVNPRHDNSESLLYYVSNYARGFLEDAGLRCRIESPERLPETVLTSQVRHHLFVGCKEALNNVVKHAHASEVVVRFSARDGFFSVAIADDGQGRPGATAPVDRLCSGNGMGNMRQRMEEIGGICEVASNPGGGTVVTFTVPLTPAAALAVNRLHREGGAVSSDS
jgi:signal transduction histidine kinase/ligand-binding sensor domain-containing protein